MLPRQWTSQRTQRAGRDITIVGGFGRPFGVTLDARGHLYAADFTEHRVVRISPDLTEFAWIGATDGDKAIDSGWKSKRKRSVSSAEPGGFNRPHSIDFDTAGIMYVTEYAGCRIQKFNPDGYFCGFVDPGHGAGAFSGPATAYFDAADRLYVADYAAHRILAFDGDGSFLGWVGARASGDVADGFGRGGNGCSASQSLGGFNKPHMVRAAPCGALYVADTWNHRIQKLSHDGRALGWIGAIRDGMVAGGWVVDGNSVASNLPGGFNAPVAIDIENSGDFIVAEYGNPRIQLFSPDGRFKGWVGGRSGGSVTNGWETGGSAAEGKEPGSFRHPYDAKIRNGKLYVADTENGRLQIIAMSENTPD